jgi:PAS domain S-box-containing protein
MLAQLSADFINAPVEVVDGRIEEGLRQLVTCAQADRAILAQMQPTGRLRITHSYAIHGFRQMPRIIMNEELPWFSAMLSRGHMLRLASCEDLPAEAAHEKRWMQQMGVRASLMIPFTVGGKLVCTIALETGREQQWPEPMVHWLRLAGDIIANALARVRSNISRLESEGRFKQLADAAPMMIWMSGPDRLCTYFNQRWLHFTGRTMDHEVGDGWAEGIHPDDLHRCAEIYSRAFDARQAFEMEYRLRRFDGEYRWILDMGVPRFDSDQTFEGYIGSCLDITGRKRMEEEMRKSETRQRMLLESSNAVPWLADAQTWQFTYVGPQATRLLGYPAGAWLEKDFWQQHVHPEDRDAAIAFCVEHSKRDRDYEFDYRMLAADGRAVWVHDIVNVVKVDGAPQILQGFLVDITQRKASEEELRALREQIVRVSRVSMMGEFAAAITHEVNQPLCAIVSNAMVAEQLVAAGQFKSREFRATMRDISEDGRRASAVISKMRSLFMQGPASYVVVEVNEIIRDVAALVQAEMVRRGITLKLDLISASLEVLGDGIQLQQVLLNLITNAAEAMDVIPRGQRKLTLISTVNAKAEVIISVKDAGIGIDRQTEEHAFEPFFSTKSSGMGMGLAICKSILSVHHGRLWFERNVDAGMTFSFSLPRRK